MMLETLTADDRVTAVAGTGRVGDPSSFAMAAGFADEVLADRNGGNIAFVTADTQHLGYGLGLTRYDSSRGDHRRVAYFGAPEVWHKSPSAIGNELGGAIRSFDATTLVVVDHADSTPEKWAWAQHLAKADRCVVLSTAPLGGERWRIYNNPPSTLPELVKVTLADDGAAAQTLTVKATAFHPADGVAGDNGFDSTEPRQASFTWEKGGTLPDLDKWRADVAECQRAAEQDMARHWLAAHRPDLDTIPPALLEAAPWLATTPNSDNGK